MPCTVGVATPRIVRSGAKKAFKAIDSCELASLRGAVQNCIRSLLAMVIRAIDKQQRERNMRQDEACN